MYPTFDPLLGPQKQAPLYTSTEPGFAPSDEFLLNRSSRTLRRMFSFQSS